MSKELTTEEYYNKLWLENKELIQENIERLDKKRFALQLMLAEKDKEIERLNNIIEEAIEYMNKHEIEEVYLDCKLYETQVYKDILEILDKGE